VLKEMRKEYGRKEGRVKKKKERKVVKVKVLKKQLPVKLQRIFSTDWL
jgi:hypothetical protein